MLVHMCADPPGANVSGVQSVPGRGAGEAHGEGFDPAEPEQRAGTHNHEGRDFFAEEGKLQLQLRAAKS